MGEQERDGWLGLAGRLATTLPPVLLAVLAINILFVGTAFWLLRNAQAARAEIITLILNRCTAGVTQ